MIFIAFKQANPKKRQQGKSRQQSREWLNGGCWRDGCQNVLLFLDENFKLRTSMQEGRAKFQFANSPIAMPIFELYNEFRIL